MEPTKVNRNTYKQNFSSKFLFDNLLDFLSLRRTKKIVDSFTIIIQKMILKLIIFFSVLFQSFALGEDSNLGKYNR